MTGMEMTVSDEQVLINSNGTLYIAGWSEDAPGWFDITHVEAHPEKDDVYVTVGDYPHTSFTSEGTDKLIQAINRAIEENEAHQ